MNIVRIDKEKNRLNIILGGVINISEAEEVRNKIISSVERLQPGFTVLNDISKFIHGDESAGCILQEVIKYYIQKKAEKIVRVVGQSKTGLMQFAKYSQIDEPIEIKYVPTMAEAEKLLG